MPSKKEFFKYTEDDLRSALDEYHGDPTLKIRPLCRKWNLPHATFLRRVKQGDSTGERKMGPPTILTTEEEDLLEKWILANAKKGIPVSRQVLCETVQEVVQADGRNTPFKDGLPGKHWFEVFLRRHPAVHQRHAEGINLARAAVTEHDIREWHKGLKEYLIEENAIEIIEDPRRILNSDESGFATCPKTGLVLGPKGFKNFYEVKSGADKENITVLVTADASGAILPPMVVLPYQRIPKPIVDNMNPAWAVGRSESGWMTGQAFFGYVANSLLPYLKEQNVQFPVLYLVDGHKSHLTLNVAKLCKENGIILYSLYPNATHILQPADVSIFKPLKSNWKKIVHDWKRQTGNRAVTKGLFSTLLENALSGVTADTVRNGFRKCGLFPFDPDAIDYSKCMTHDSRKESVKPAEFGVEHLLYMESLFPKQRTKQFRKSGVEWEGSESAKELFYVWKRIKKSLMGRSMDAENSEHETEASEEEPAKELEDERQPQLQGFEEGATWGSFEEPTEEEGFEERIEEEYKEEASERSRPDKEIEEKDRKKTGVYENVIEAGKEKERPPREKSPNDDREETEEATQTSVENITEDETDNRTIRTSLETVSSKRRVSTSFIDHVYWPNESPEKKRMKNERIPHAATSKRWLEYWTDKENMKKRQEEAKTQRAEERKKKKEETIMKTKNKSKSSQSKKAKKAKEVSSESDENEWNETGNSEDDLSDYIGQRSSSDDDDDFLEEKPPHSVKDWVLVEFKVPNNRGIINARYYVGHVSNVVSDTDVTVTFLRKKGINFIFPNVPDVSIVGRDTIKKVLPEPSIRRGLHFFNVKFPSALCLF